MKTLAVAVAMKTFFLLDWSSLRCVLADTIECYSASISPFSPFSYPKVPLAKPISGVAGAGMRTRIPIYGLLAAYPEASLSDRPERSPADMSEVAGDFELGDLDPSFLAVEDAFFFFDFFFFGAPILNSPLLRAATSSGFYISSWVYFR